MLMQFYRVDAIPNPVIAGVCYITRASGTGAASMHFVSADGQSVHTMTGISTSTSAHNMMESVADIAERDSLVSTVSGIVYVQDASDDVEISSGSATYYYDHDTDTFTLTSSSTNTGMWENTDW